MTTSLKPDFDLIDESLDEIRAATCNLTVYLSDQNFSFTVLDPRQQKYLALQSFRNPAALLPADYSLWLGELIGSSKPLSWHFHDTQVFIANRSYTLMPAPLFNPEQKQLPLTFNIEADLETHDIMTDHLPSLEAMTIFAYPKWMGESLKLLLPGHSLHHAVSALIEGTLGRFKYQTTDGQVFLNIQTGIFDLLLFQEQRLVLCNTFPYQSAEDILYYVIFILEQRKANPDNITIHIMGEIGKHSAIVELLGAYIPHIEFLTRNPTCSYTHPFDEIPEHYFYNLLNAALCEL